jgi:drug/metabolite transporter (DMT)-like permease
MALLGWIVLREKLSQLQTFGIFLAACGVLLVVTEGNFGNLASGKFGTIGDFLILISAVNWAVFSALSRRMLKVYPATRMMFYVMSFGWIFSSVQFFGGPGFSEVHNLAWDGWLGVIFLGVFCSGLAYIFWYDALQALPVAQTGAFLYFEPLVTVVVAALVLGEPLLAASLLGGGIILLGVWMVNHQEQKG